MSENEDGTARQEIVKQTVILVFSLAGTVGTIFLMRYLNNPDFLRENKMRLALAGQQFCSRQAHWWDAKSKWFVARYDEERA